MIKRLKDRIVKKLSGYFCKDQLSRVNNRIRYLADNHSVFFEYIRKGRDEQAQQYLKSNQSLASIVKKISANTKSPAKIYGILDKDTRNSLRHLFDYSRRVNYRNWINRQRKMNQFLKYARELKIEVNQRQGNFVERDIMKYRCNSSDSLEFIAGRIYQKYRKRVQKGYIKHYIQDQVGLVS